MKSLKQLCNINIPNSLHSLLEASLLDIDANLDITDEEAIKSAITQFINDNYTIVKFTISDKPNKYGKYEVSTEYNASVRNKNITSLTNDLFVWNKVEGNFSCYECKSLRSLVGSPKKVLGRFDCSDCKSLKSLEGAPKEVGGGFNCSKCNYLINLNGSPEVVEGYFACHNCDSLKSLEGAPKEVGGSFICYLCSSLQSLKGAPKKVGDEFDCSNCKVKFEESDIRAVSNVKRKIIV